MSAAETRVGQVEESAEFYRAGWLALTQELRRRQALHLSDPDRQRYHLCQYLASVYGLKEVGHPMTESIQPAEATLPVQSPDT
jgi:hypothetical protein